MSTNNNRSDDFHEQRSSMDFESPKAQLRQMFYDAGINPRFHFTKLGYYKLFGSERYLFALVFQLVFLLFFGLAFVMLILAVTSSGGADISRLLLYFTISSAAASFSDAFFGDWRSACRWFIIGLICSLAFHWQ